MAAQASASGTGINGPVAADEPVWSEMEAPAPPAFSAAKLVAIDVGPNSAVSFGVDPATVSVGADGVVRYVVVAASRGGASTAMYEGIRCATGEVKTYARFNDGKWQAANGSEWRSLFNNSANRHSMALAKQGACENTSPARNADEMLRTLKSPPSQLAH